jgi:hypothetical protein
MKYSLLEGIVANLDRTTDVSGGGKTAATTTHVALFSLAGQRVLLRTRSPAMISNGDHLKIVGQHSPGQFSALACKNLSTGWMTSPHAGSCAMISLIVFTLVGFALAWIFPLTFFVPLLSGSAIIVTLIGRSRLKEIDRMLNS